MQPRRQRSQGHIPPLFACPLLWLTRFHKHMSKITVGILGLGTVGTGVAKLLGDDPRFRVKWIAVRDRLKPRDADLSAIRLTDQPSEVVNDPETEIIIEVAGGVGPIFEWI